ncbi:MAG: hypothetical protein COB85_00675, partial [Bacteroidetes bacterium]
MNSLRKLFVTSSQACVLFLTTILLLVCNYSIASSSEEYISGQLFVKVNDSNTENLLYSGEEGSYPLVLSEIILNFQITSISRASKLDDPKLSRTYLIKFTDYDITQELIYDLSQLPFIEYAEKVPGYKFFYTPNDIHPNQWHIAKVLAEEAWDITTGNTNIVIAMVDDAILLSHEDLAPSIWVNPLEIPGNGIDDEPNGYIDDINGWDAADNDNDPNPLNPTNSYFTHGTHCAGIAAAKTDNNIGIASVGFNVSLMAVKIGADANSLLYGAFQGVEYAIAAGANIISMSWGGGSFSQTYQNLFDLAHNQGIVLIAAAGNSNTTIPMYPAAYNYIISVGATNSSDQKASFSNYGSTIDVMAPGQSIWSSLAGSSSSYGSMSGTSMACPLVSSLAALMLSWDPSLTPDELEDCLKSSCDNIDAQNPAYTGQIGAGRINAKEALLCLKAINADFTSNYVLICPGDTVQFTDLTNNNPTSWQWSFPGGFPSSSNLQNPYIIYGSAGTYDVTLIATNIDGSDTITRTAYVSVAVPTAVISGTMTIPAGFSANLRVDLTGNPNWSITYFDGTSNFAVNNITNTPYYITVTPADTTTYTLVSVNDNGCAGAVSGSSTVYVIQPGSGNDTICLILQPGPILGKDALIRALLGVSDGMNYGTYEYLNMHAWTNLGDEVWHRQLIEFDITQIPANSLILNAKLSLYSDPTSSIGNENLSGPNDCMIQRLTSAWDENTVTWGSQPTTTTVNQVAIPQIISKYQDHVADILALMQDMVNNPSTSHGLMIKLQTESYYRRMRFASSDNADSTKWPKLEICYVAPTSPTQPCIQVKSHQKISSTKGNFTGILADSDLFGADIENIGDLDGDGVDDLAVGAQYDDDGGSSNGAVWILFMNSNGTVKSQQKISELQGNFTGTFSLASRFGTAIAPLGDLNNDGIFDIAVGARGDDDGGSDRGAIWILFLDTNGSVKSHQKISDLAGNFGGILDDGDQFGRSVTSIGDLNGDNIIDLVVGADKDDDGGTDKGAVWVLFLNANGTVNSHQKVSSTQGAFTGALSNGDNFGTEVALINDVNGDNIPDIVVGASFDDGGGTDRGAVWILFLDTNGTVKTHQKISSTQGGYTGGLNNGDNFGAGISAINDLDGNGVDDILISSLYDDDGGPNRGAIRLLYLDNSGNVIAHMKISNTQGNFNGVLDDSDAFSYNLTSLGDLDGDGFTDIAVGAFGDDDGGTDRGAVWILFLEDTCAAPPPPCPQVKSHQKISDISGNFTGTLVDSDIFGADIANIGDLDGDGVDDLAVGAQYDGDGGTWHGAVWILFMNTDGTVKSQQKISDTQGNFTGTFTSTCTFGSGIAPLGDLDGDSVPDIAVGARRDNDGGTRRGAIWILFLNTDGTVKSYQKISSTQGNFSGGLANGDEFGRCISLLGDLDGDSIIDIVVGANYDDDGGTDKGAVWVLFLNANGTVKSQQKISNTQGGFSGLLDNSDSFGMGVASLGDINGDNIPDLAVGARSDDDGGTDRGAVWVLFMNINGTVQGYQKISSTQGGFTGILNNSDGFGFGISAAGDLDGNGIGDLLVGTILGDDGGTDKGAVWVLYLNSTGSVSSYFKISETAGNFTGSLSDGDWFGYAVAEIGDLDGDGYGDIAVGAISDNDGGTDRGAVWILFLEDTCAIPPACDTTFTYNVEVCIDGRTLLHVDSTAMWWEHLSYLPPGDHNTCAGFVAEVNGNTWAPWDTTYILPYNTDGCILSDMLVTTCFETCSLIQAPTAGNG